MERLRILMLCSDTGVRVGDGKGAAVHLRAVARAFARAGHAVEVVGVAASGLPVDWDVPVHLVAHPGRSSGLEREHRKLATVDAVSALGRAVAARQRPHVVYERLSLFGTAGLEVAGSCGAQHVLEVNALLAAEEAAWRGLVLADRARRTEESVLRGATVRVAVSEEVAAAVATVTRARTVVVPNGVETELFAAVPDAATARRALGLPADRALVSFAGSLRPWHGLDRLVAALELLPERVQLVVAGEGPVRADLTRQAQALGVGERITWLGALAHDQVPLLLAASDVAVAPYPALAGFFFSPLKVYEYLASGAPVVASAVGQVVPALDRGRFGTLVPPGDVLALADAIAAVIAAPEPARRRAALARTHALIHHGWDARVADILRALDVGERAGAGGLVQAVGS